ELSDDELLLTMAMVDDAGQLRLAGLWLLMGQAVINGVDADVATVAEVTLGVQKAGEPGEAWLRRAAEALVADTQEVAGRAAHRISAPLVLVKDILAEEAREQDPAPLVHGCLQLARFVRARAGIGPGTWVELPLPAAVQALGASLAVSSAVEQGVAGGTDLELLAGLMEPDLEPVETLDAFVCATAQLLVQASMEPGIDLAVPVAEALGAVRSAARWLLVGVLRSAHEHDPGSPDLTPVLADEPDRDLDRVAARAGVPALLRDGVHVLGALADALGPRAGVTREEVFALVLPSALAEHDLLRRPR
ncbi:MAG: hypothetical protein ABI181_14460, partial [Mycobacteriaceae bacterium]